MGFVEGLNIKILVIQLRCYGLRDEDYLRLKILTCTLPPHAPPAVLKSSKFTHTKSRRARIEGAESARATFSLTVTSYLTNHRAPFFIEVSSCGGKLLMYLTGLTQEKPKCSPPVLLWCTHSA